MTQEFRAWAYSGNENKMYGNEEALRLMYNNAARSVLLHRKDFVIMQFTGLIDENANRVFVGDIILNDDRGEKAIVKFDKDKAMFVVEYVETKHVFPLWESISNAYCVVGNIYENADLIK